MTAHHPLDVTFLGEEHTALRQLLDNLEQHGLFAETSRYQLLELESAILHHLDQEERWLYPTLWRKVAGLPELRHKVNEYHRLMNEVSMQVALFFDLYHRGETPDEAQRAFNLLLPIFRERIRMEDEFLYPLLQLPDL